MEYNFYNLYDDILYEGDKYTILLVRNFREKQAELKRRIEKAEDIDRFKLQIELERVRNQFINDYITAILDKKDIQAEYNIYMGRNGIRNNRGLFMG